MANILVKEPTSLELPDLLPPLPNIDITEEEFHAVLRHDFPTFVKKCFSFLREGIELKWNWHLDVQCSWYVDIFEGKRKRVIINVPPRSLKSFIFSIAGPAWVLGHKPWEEMMNISYSGELSEEHSVLCRQIMASEWYKKVFPKARLSADQNEKDKFKTVRNGQRISTSVGGSATGFGGNIITLDDPMNPKNANSDTVRDSANKWVDNTVYSRLNNKDTGVIIIVMQRLHEDDTVGHILKKENKDEWDHLVLPAYNDTQEDMVFEHRYGKKVFKPGELLHPDRLSQKFLVSEKANILSSEFAGQYLQRPAPKDGTIFKAAWLKKTWGTDRLPYLLRVQSWDTAAKATELNDPSACTTWGLHSEGFDLLNVFNERLLYPDLKAKVKTMAKDWKADIILIEDKSSGQSLIQDIRMTTTLPIKAITPLGDKVVRAYACAAQFENGRIFLPESAYWKEEFTTQLLRFPNVKHDDIVDSVSQFLGYVAFMDLKDLAQEKELEYDSGEGDLDSLEIGAGY